MLDLIIPDGEWGDAASFTQDGGFLMAGHREECEQCAISNSGLYCWIVGGRAVIRSNFETACARGGKSRRMEGN